jgi:hypothetical protein
MWPEISADNSVFDEFENTMVEAAPPSVVLWDF